MVSNLANKQHPYSKNHIVYKDVAFSAQHVTLQAGTNKQYEITQISWVCTRIIGDSFVLFIDAYTNGKITKNKEGHIYFLSVSVKMCLKTMHIQGYDFFKGDRGI